MKLVRERISYHIFHRPLILPNEIRIPAIKIEVSSLIIQNYFNFENSSFVVHFTLDQTGVLFLGHPVVELTKFRSLGFHIASA